MHNTIISLLLVLFSLGTSSYAQPLINPLDYRLLNDMMQLSNAHFLVAGTIADNNFNAYLPSLFLCDTAGNVLDEWIDSTATPRPYGPSQKLARFANGDILIGLDYADEWYLQRFNPTTKQRTIIYSRQDTVGRNSYITDLEILDNQDILIAGFDEKPGFNGYKKHFIRRINPQGTEIWALPNGPTGYFDTEQCYLVRKDSLLFAAIQHESSVSFRGYILQQLSLSGQILVDTLHEYINLDFVTQDISLIGDSSVLVMGHSKPFLQTTDVAPRLINLDFNGNILWEQTYQVAGEKLGMRSISQLDSDGNLTFTATESAILNLQNFHLFKINPTGSLIWRKEISYGVSDAPTRGMFVLPSDRIMLCGNTYSFGPLANQFPRGFIAKIEADGTNNVATLTGKVFEDTNGNGAQDPSEQTLPQHVVYRPQGPFNVTTNTQGQFALPIFMPDSFDLKVALPQYWDYTLPSNGLTGVELAAPINNSSLPIIDFGIRPILGITDLKLTASNSAFRPGFIAYIYLLAQNKGTTSLQNPTFKYVGDTIATLLAVQDPNYTLVGDTLIWNPGVLQPGEEWTCKLSLQIPPNVNLLGDSLNYVFCSEIAQNDTTPDNNKISTGDVIRGAYDPNDKQVNPRGSGLAGTIPTDTKSLEYTIRFQNTGTDTAFTVMVVDTLDSNLIIPHSIRDQISSHDFHFQLEGKGIVKWTFFNIQLPDSTTDLDGSQGFIQFSVDLQAGLPDSTQIQNGASIYFDFNPPIHTNKTLNTLFDCPPSFTQTTHVSICEGDSLFIAGDFRRVSGLYVEQFSNGTFCDSIFQTQLTVETIDKTIRFGQDSIIAVAGYDQYQWYNCTSGMMIPGANEAVFLPTNSGIYQVEITNAQCSYYSDCKAFQLVNLESKDFKDNISVFPNPVSNDLRVDLRKPISDLHYQLIDGSGKRLQQGKLVQKDHFVIDFSAYPPGIYLLKFHHDEHAMSVKIYKP